MRAVLLVLVLLATNITAQTQVPDAAQFVGAPQGVRLEGEALNRRTHEVSALLRCPVCQGLSVNDSPAEMAVNMKGQVRDLLSRGYTEEQILQYFEQSYGQYVLLKPKFEGFNTLVWLLPLIALLIGIAVVAIKMRKLKQDDPYLDQVRKLVAQGKK